MRWVALLGLATGAVLDSAFGPYRGKETGETALFRTLLSSLLCGDVVLADRYYCSYWLVAVLQARGVEVVFRKHHLRHTDFRRGRRLGRNDHLVTWTKPPRPKWMDQATYDSLPETVELREVRTQVATPGCRVKELIVVTTLRDYETYSKEEILDLYHQRWHAETMFQEMRAYLGLETTRGRCAQTVLRVAPCLFGLYSVVAVLYTQMPARYRRLRIIDWPGKRDVTFSDAITAVRRWLGVEWVFAVPGHREAFAKLALPFRRLVLYGPAPAA